MRARQAGLGLDEPARAMPTQPTLFTWLAGQTDALRFHDLDELARKVHDLADGRGVRLAAEPSTTAFDGFSLFRAWSIYAVEPDGGEAWLCHAAVQATTRDRLEAALLRAGAASGRQAAA